MHIQPGLAFYAGNPRVTAQTLDVLLDEALRFVPASLHSCTLVAVKVTAGLRQLGRQESIEMLNTDLMRYVSVHAVKLRYSCDHGREGHSWATTNYLLDTICGLASGCSAICGARLGRRLHASRVRARECR